MNRREFLRVLPYLCAVLSGLAGRNLRAAELREEGEHPAQFVFAQVRYRGGDWDPHPLGVAPLMDELMRRTSVTAALTRRTVDLGEADLFSYPFLYMAGKYDFTPFTERETETLRKFLSYGGFLLVDDALGQPGYGFHRSFQREIRKVFPKGEIKRLPASHAALRSYYLIKKIGGMRMVHPYVEGITLGTSTPVIYCHNNLGGAWERDSLGNWVNACIPGGEEQRRDAFHLGINLIVYAMTENYKEDLIHVPFIRRRLTR